MCTLLSCAQPVLLSTEKQLYPGTYSRHFQQVFTAMQNQAALAYIPVLSAGVSTERRFMLKALSMHTVTLALPVPPGTFAFTLQQAGYSAYHQQQMGVAYGRKLGNKLSIGMQVDYFSKAIRQYGRADAVTFELGCLLHITPQLHAGLHAFNPVAGKLGNEPMPVIYTAGLGYEVSDAFLISAAVIQQDDATPATSIMCEYRIIPQLSLQLGLSPDPQFSSAAASFTLGSMRIFLSATHHPQLGFTPTTSIIWHLKKKAA
ncbi:hypothetical protein SAMN05518672_101518 [Chitinophaga sp. CF118]|uniref:hypothetical protein n=1 Tax=Chitinophaga sp. CF118 TaxID=1884367 RepID=UPI0008F26658|nr:hypothetical protein [Chitinophaga sp. CF118]SFD10960.1 hypothetical protein SAMN05518672_101518 [Chitinophaga sp. CF118]